MAISYIAETFNTETRKYDREVKTIAVGATLDKWQGSVQVMFDEWAPATFASYWDEADQRIKQVSQVNNVTIDATPEVMAKVKNFLYAQAYAEALTEAEIEAGRIDKGSVVKVARGRASKGVQGKVVVAIQRPYQTGYRSNMELKLGIATSDVKIKVPAANGRVYENYRDVVWAWARNVDLIEVPEVNLEEVRERAQSITETNFKPYQTAVQSKK